jgi:hypothetical protein
VAYVSSLVEAAEAAGRRPRPRGLVGGMGAGLGSRAPRQRRSGAGAAPLRHVQEGAGRGWREAQQPDH